MAFNFETLIAAHSSAVRAMRWSHSGSTLLSADQNGVIKYWQSTMTLVNEIPQTHNGQPVRALDFAPGDSKFVSCSDDGTIRIWDWELFKVRSIRAFFLASCLLLLCFCHPSLFPRYSFVIPPSSSASSISCLCRRSS